MKETQGQTLKHLLEKDRRGISGIAEELKIDRGTIYNLFQKDIIPLKYVEMFKEIGIELITETPIRSIAPKRKTLSVGFRVNDGPEETTIISPANRSTEKPHKPIPIYDIDAMAGNMNLFKESHAEYIIDYVDLPTLRDTTAVINVLGDSMYPTYKRGDMIAIKELKDHTQVEYGQAYVLITDENIWIKRIDKHPHKDSFALRSDNESFGEMEVEKKKIQRLFKVRGIIRPENH